MTYKLARRHFLASSAATAIALGITPATALARRSRRARTLNVCCNARSIRFVGPQGPNPLDASDPGPHPYYGASFVVQGAIYRDGLFDDAGISAGLLEDGSPEFPEQVIGYWICRGWFVGDSDGDGAITPGDDDALGGIFTPAGRFVATTQIYDLDLPRTGSRTLVSDGIERIELDVPFKRAITGGSGPFHRVRGEVTQTAVAANATGLFNFVFDFDLNPRVPLY